MEGGGGGRENGQGLAAALSALTTRALNTWPCPHTQSNCTLKETDFSKLFTLCCYRGYYQAQNQMSSMWKQLESLHKTMDGGSEVDPIIRT